MDVHLPRTKDNRLTINVGQVAGERALGFGYAYRISEDEDDTMLLFSVGRSDDEMAVRGGVSFEF